jgi:hypothetical protein
VERAKLRLSIDDGVAVAIASSSRVGSAMPSSFAARISAAFLLLRRASVAGRIVEMHLR